MLEFTMHGNQFYSFIFYLLKWYILCFLTVMIVPFSIPFEFNGKNYLCEIEPIKNYWDKQPTSFQVTLNNVYFGIISFTGKNWESDTNKNNLVEKIGNIIHEQLVLS
ncbi:MAG TPA: hypothetical protein VKR53_06535 [Puia sp.]|nr:hypothetical protein [Puia sp.]